MAWHQLLQTVNRISSYPGGNRLHALWRHSLWQLRRNWHHYPYEITITPRSKIVIGSRAAANGCAALAWSLGRYDYDNMAFIQDVLARSNAPKVFFDIGANIGIYSLLASEETRTHVFAFEPHPATAVLLASNLQANHRQNVTVERCALSSVNGSLSLTDHPGSPVNHLVEDSGKNNFHSISIPTLRAEDYCRQKDLVPHFVKIDVEGHEAEVLQGFGPLLDSVQMLIIEENLPSHLLQTHLPTGKFTAFYVDFKAKILKRTSSQWQQDLVFVNNDFLSDLISLGYQLEDHASPVSGHD